MIASFDLYYNEAKNFNKVTGFFKKIDRLKNNFFRKILEYLLFALLLVLSPLLYFWTFRILKRNIKNLALVKQQVHILSVAEIERLKNDLEKIRSAEGNVEDLEKVPVFLKPMILVFKENLRASHELISIIDSQLEKDYQLFEEALKTTTPIGF